jgi:hypothetical protein
LAARDRQCDRGADGLILSSIVVGLPTGWKGGEMVFRYRVAVYAEPRGLKANPVRS